jgi:hypothetical protein
VATSPGFPLKEKHMSLQDKISKLVPSFFTKNGKSPLQVLTETRDQALAEKAALKQLVEQQQQNGGS